MLRPQGSVGLGLRQRKSYFGFIHTNMQYDFECTCHTSKGIYCTVETLIRGWALINFLGFQGGRLFEVGAYSVGAYSNKYGIGFPDKNRPSRNWGTAPY